MPVSQQKDYYKILGVDRKADDKAIKSAFRKLARKHHPDVNKGDAAAEERFKDLNEAHDVLSEPASRKLYDRYGADWERYRDAGFTGDEPAGTSRAGYGNLEDLFTRPGNAGSTTFHFETGEHGGLGDLFGSMFSGRRGSERFTSRRPTRHKGQDLEVPVEVSFNEAFQGTSRRIEVQTPEPCATCEGVGYVRGGICPTCDSSGSVQRAKTIEVKIPAGVATGSRVRVAGQGSPGTGGAPNGDVWLNVTVRPDARFERAGDDLKTEIDVPLYTAVLGGEAVVPTPTGRVALAVPAGSQSGRQFRLRGQGMPKLKGKSGERGDLLARIRIAIPEDLTERELQLFRELKSLRPA
jgi:DnaJ-class molecular chaperone